MQKRAQKLNSTNSMKLIPILSTNTQYIHTHTPVKHIFTLHFRGCSYLICILIKSVGIWLLRSVVFSWIFLHFSTIIFNAHTITEKAFCVCENWMRSALIYICFSLKQQNRFVCKTRKMEQQQKSTVDLVGFVVEVEMKRIEKNRFMEH